MSDTHLLQVLRPQLEDLKAKGLYKRERQIQGPQGASHPRRRPRGGELLRQ